MQVYFFLQGFKIEFPAVTAVQHIEINGWFCTFKVFDQVAAPDQLTFALDLRNDLSEAVFKLDMSDVNAFQVSLRIKKQDISRSGQYFSRILKALLNGALS